MGSAAVTSDVGGGSGGAAGAQGGAAVSSGKGVSATAVPVTRALILTRISEIESDLSRMGATHEFCSSYYGKMAGGCVCKWGACCKHIINRPPLPDNLVPADEYTQYLGELKGQMQILSNAGMKRRTLYKELGQNESINGFFADGGEGDAGSSRGSKVCVCELEFPFFTLMYLCLPFLFFVCLDCRRLSRIRRPSSRTS